MSASNLRQSNERAVLITLAMNQGASGAELARLTGLGPQTVSRILNQLADDDLILRGEPRRGQRGQPAVPISINPEAAYSIGCRIGWRHMSAVICDLHGRRIGEVYRDYAYPDPATVVGDILRFVEELKAKLPEAARGRIKGLGVAIPSGLPNKVKLIARQPEVAAGWAKLDLQAELEGPTGLPVMVMNDGSAACWAELILRPAPRPHSMAYVFVGWLLKGGLVAEGRLWEGPNGNSANLGSLLVSDSQGGRQVGHLVSSIYAFERKLAARGIAMPQGERLEWDNLGEVLDEWLDEAATGLAEIVYNTLTVSDVPLTIIDGVLPDGPLERLIALTRVKLEQIDGTLDPVPVIERGVVGPMAAATGAAYRPLFLQYFARDMEQVLAVPEQVF